MELKVRIVRDFYEDTPAGGYKRWVRSGIIKRYPEEHALKLVEEGYAKLVDMPPQATQEPAELETKDAPTEQPEEEKKPRKKPKK